MLYSLHTDQGIGDPSNVLSFPFHYQHFEAVVVIEVHVHGGENVVK